MNQEIDRTELVPTWSQVRSASRARDHAIARSRPVPSSPVDLNPAEGGALRESPRGGAGAAEPVAPRRHEEHRASRRGMSTGTELENSQVFRLLCALIRRELRAHPELNWGEGYTDLVEHMKTASARAHLPYGQDKLTRALHAVEQSDRPRRPRPHADVPPLVHWRDRCEMRGHPRWCSTPTQCELRAAKESK
jgi:hypothetical protein